jgi:hypothetical protein
MQWTHGPGQPLEHVKCGTFKKEFNGSPPLKGKGLPSIPGVEKYPFHQLIVEKHVKSNGITIVYTNSPMLISTDQKLTESEYEEIISAVQNAGYKIKAGEENLLRYGHYEKQMQRALDVLLNGLG